MVNRPLASFSDFRWAFAFVGLLIAHAIVAHIGWADQGFAGHEFRQSQTAISTYFIQRDHDYRLAYPTPILGKPWSLPMEFPLYQWTVAKLCEWFGFSLVQTGRAVSLGCFYLTLPAWFLMLGEIGLPAKRRLAVLMVTLTCPIYILYSRAFMIESMALLFASWLAWCVLGAIRDGHWRWLLGAWLAGAGAALVKVTTWAAVLLPCAIYVLWLFLSAIRKQIGWRLATRPPLRSLAAVTPSLLVAWWWVRTADAIKAQNPAAHFLTSKNLVLFNFGTLDQRLSPEFWSTLYRHWTTILLPLPALLFTLVAGIGWRGPWRNLITLLLGAFIGIQLLFANLFALHSYYFFSTGFLLLGAFGLAGCQLLDRPSWPAWARVSGWSLLLAAGAVTYEQNFLTRQRTVVGAGNGLTEAIQSLTNRDDIIVVIGDDWSSVIPFTARHRALMVRSGTETDDALWQKSVAGLKGEQVPLLLVKGAARAMTDLIKRRATDLQMQPQPLFSFKNSVDVYVRKDYVHTVLGRLRGASYSEIDIPRNEASPGGIQQFDFHRDRAAFFIMKPYPVAYQTPYDVPPWFEYENSVAFMAHVPTKLDFAIPAGTTAAALEFGMVEDAYLQHGSDGVELVAEQVSGTGTPREIWRRRLNPRDCLEDRPRQSVTIPLNSSVGDHLIVRSLPGPAGNRAFDWVYFTEITLH